MQRKLYVIVLGVLLAAQLTLSVADASGPDTIESIQDLRQAVNDIASAQPEQAQTKADALYQALVAANRIPLVFGQQVVFLYKGTAESVTWRGTFTRWSDGPGLAGGRIGQTDLWIAQAEMPPASRFEYKLILNGKDWLLDPGNPNVVASNDTQNNVLALPGFMATDYTLSRSGVPAGTLNSALVITSTHLGYPVQYWVYAPAGYASAKDLPAFYFTDGNDWSNPRAGAITTVFDNLIADGRVKPAIAVFVNERDPERPDYNRREDEFLAHPEEYARFIAQELVPAVDKAYRTKASADSRVIVGVSYGGVIASFIAGRYPEVFNNLAALSPSMWIFRPDAEWDPAKAAGIRKMLPVMDSLTNCGAQTGVQCRTQPLKIFASAGFPTWDVGNLAPTAEGLGQRYPVQFIQVQEGHAWTAWRSLADEMLIYLDGTAN